MSTLSDPTHEPQTDRDFGFWLYLMSDTILFSLLFATFIVMSGNTAGGPAGHDLFDLGHLTQETALLLTSTLTIAFAYQAARNERVAGAVLWLAVTLCLGAGFVALELIEFKGMIDQGAGPGRSGYLSAFFTLVGTHGLHVTTGLLWGLTMILQLIFKGPTPEVNSRLLRLTLFWHFLDIVWIGVFSVVYLPSLI